MDTNTFPIEKIVGKKRDLALTDALDKILPKDLISLIQTYYVYFIIRKKKVGGNVGPLLAYNNRIWLKKFSQWDGFFFEDPIQEEALPSHVLQPVTFGNDGWEFALNRTKVPKFDVYQDTYEEFSSHWIINGTHVMRPKGGEETIFKRDHLLFTGEKDIPLLYWTSYKKNAMIHSYDWNSIKLDQNIPYCAGWSIFLNQVLVILAEVEFSLAKSELKLFLYDLNLKKTSQTQTQKNPNPLVPFCTYTLGKLKNTAKRRQELSKNEFYLLTTQTNIYINTCINEETFFFQFDFSSLKL